MTLPLERYFSNDNDERQLQVTDMYADVAQTINGTMHEWIPKIYGSTVAGTITYTEQEGWYYRQGIMTDIWFKVGWSAIGAGAGNLNIKLPFKSKITKTSGFWIGTAYFSSVTLTSNYEVLIFKINSDSYVGYFEQLGSAMPSLSMGISSSGIVGAHIRYYGNYLERA